MDLFVVKDLVTLGDSNSVMREYEIAAYEPLGIVLVETARDFFRQAGVSHDFCIQRRLDDEEAKQIALEKRCLEEGYPVIFGGWNRLMWHPITGWTISASHCTPNFIATFKEIMASGEWKTE